MENLLYALALLCDHNNTFGHSHKAAAKLA